MEQGFIWPLAVMAVGGVAWFAYQHPKEYLWLYYGLGGLILLSEIFMTTWNVAVYRSEMAGLHYVPFDKQGAAESAFKAVEFPDPFITGGIAFGIIVYLSCLFLLRILTEKKQAIAQWREAAKRTCREMIAV